MLVPTLVLIWLYMSLYRHTIYSGLTAVVLYYIVSGSHVQSSTYNNLRSMCTFHTCEYYVNALIVSCT